MTDPSPRGDAAAGRWFTEVPGWAWNLPSGPYRGRAAGYAAALDLDPDGRVCVRHRIVLGTGACRFASRVVVPADVLAAFPGVAADPYRRLRDLESVLSAAGCRPRLSTSCHRAVVDPVLADVFAVRPGARCHRVTTVLLHPRTGRPLALGDHLSGWSTPGAPRTVTAPRTRRPPPAHPTRRNADGIPSPNRKPGASPEPQRRTTNTDSRAETSHPTSP